MKFKIDETQILEAHKVAVINVADTLQISDIYEATTEGLLEKIKSSNSSLVKPLLKYLDAYNNWAYYYMQYNDDEQLSNDIISEIQKRLTIRNHTRDNLGFENVVLRKSIEIQNAK